MKSSFQFASLLTFILLTVLPSNANDFLNDVALTFERTVQRNPALIANRQKIFIAPDLRFEDTRDESMTFTQFGGAERLKSLIHGEPTGQGINAFQVTSDDKEAELAIRHVHVYLDGEKAVCRMDLDTPRPDGGWRNLTKLEIDVKADRSGAPKVGSHSLQPPPANQVPAQKASVTARTPGSPPKKLQGGFGIRILVDGNDVPLQSSEKDRGLFLVRGLADQTEFQIQLVNLYSFDQAEIFGVASVELDGKPRFTTQDGVAMMDAIPSADKGTADKGTEAVRLLKGFGGAAESDVRAFTLVKTTTANSHHHIKVDFRFASNDKEALRKLEKDRSTKRGYSIEGGRKIVAPVDLRRAYIGQIRESIMIAFVP